MLFHIRGENVPVQAGSGAAQGGWDYLTPPPGATVGQIIWKQSGKAFVLVRDMTHTVNRANIAIE